MKNKAGSLTPGVDNEVFDKYNPETLREMVEYLRDMTYHPNKYQVSPIKRV